MAARPRHCPCREESPDPCPACGATVSGNDLVHGVCQATHGYFDPSGPENDYGVRLVLVHRNTGELI